MRIVERRNIEPTVKYNQIPDGAVFKSMRTGDLFIMCHTREAVRLKDGHHYIADEEPYRYNYTVVPNAELHV